MYASASPYDVIETWFGAPNGWGDRDGKLVPGFDTEEFFAANRWLKKWMDEGLVNQDFATLDSANWNDPFVQGKGGMIIDVNVRATDLVKLFKQKDPNDFDKVAMVGNLKRSDGQKFSLPFPGYNGIIAISKQRIRTQKQLDEVLAVLDKLEGPEGSTLLANGIEGRNFHLENGKRGSDQPGRPQGQGRPERRRQGVHPARHPGQRRARPVPAQAARPAVPGAVRPEGQADERGPEDGGLQPGAPGHLARPYVQKGATLDPIVTDARIKFLSGEITEDQLRAEVKRWYDSGGTQVAQEVNELVAKLGK